MKKKKILKELQAIRGELEMIKMRLPERKLEWRRFTPPERLFTFQEEKQTGETLLEQYLKRREAE